mgnify:CR=1 FL=1
MKKFKIYTLLALTALLLALLVGCSEADKVNHNMSKQADYFECERRVTVYNARTDNVILECEGYLSISNNDTHLECAKLSLCQNVKRRMMEKMQEFVVHGDGDKKPVGISRAEPPADG